MGMAAAVAGAAALGAVGTVAGSVISSNAANKAAKTQAQAATQASDNALAQYQQTRADLLPYNTAGQGTLPLLGSNLAAYGDTGQNTLPMQTVSGLEGNLVNLLTGSPQAIQAQLSKLPGYQFTLNQGLQATQNGNAAQGLGVSGAAMKGAAGYATGLANQTYNNQINNLATGINNALNWNTASQSNLTNSENRLLPIGQLGENAAATTGAQGVQATGNANNYLTGGAAAQAAGQVGSANAITGGMNNLASAPMNYILTNRLLNGGGTVPLQSDNPYQPGYAGATQYGGYAY